MEFKEIMKGYFWPVFSLFMNRAHFLPYNENDIFRPDSFLKHLVEPKGNQFFSYNRPKK